MAARVQGLALALVVTLLQASCQATASTQGFRPGGHAMGVGAHRSLLKVLNYTTNNTSVEVDSNVDTIVSYLVGICIGSVAISFFFVLIMAVPTLLTRAADTPTVLVAYGGKAMRRGSQAMAQGGKAMRTGARAVAAGMAEGREALQEPGAAMRKGSKAMVQGGRAVAQGSKAVAGALMHGHHGLTSWGSGAAAQATASGALPAPAPGELPAAAAAAGEEPSDVPAAPAEADVTLARNGSDIGVDEEDMEHWVPASGPSMATSPLEPAASAVSAAEFEMVQPSGAGGTAKAVIAFWLLLAGGLYIAALVLLIIGTIQLVENSVTGYSLDATGSGGSLKIIQWLIIGGLILTGVCDIVAAYVVLAATKPTFTFRRWTIRNWCYNAWVHRQAYRIHVVVAGLVVLVISVACILFGLGMITVVIQLAVRLACDELSQLSIKGVSIGNLCISVPTATGPANDYCGSAALQLCADITNMGVLLLVLGAMLLLWSHMFWLVVLLMSMWRFFSWRVVVKPAELDGKGLADSAAGTPGPTPSASAAALDSSQAVANSPALVVMTGS